MKTKENKVVKKYDTVEEMRKIRSEISSELEGMSSEQILEYFKQPRLHN